MFFDSISHRHTHKHCLVRILWIGCVFASCQWVEFLYFFSSSYVLFVNLFDIKKVKNIKVLDKWWIGVDVLRCEPLPFFRRFYYNIHSAYQKCWLLYFSFTIPNTIELNRKISVEKVHRAEKWTISHAANTENASIHAELAIHSIRRQFNIIHAFRILSLECTNSERFFPPKSNTSHCKIAREYALPAEANTTMKRMANAKIRESCCFSHVQLLFIRVFAFIPIKPVRLWFGRPFFATHSHWLAHSYRRKTA